MRAWVLAAMLFATTLAVASSPAQGGSALTGTWSWGYPNLAGGPASGHSSGLGATETGTLSLGDNPGRWTVELPSAIVGCADGRPLYTPKASGIAIVQTYPDGSCQLYDYRAGAYSPYWFTGENVGAFQAGPMWGHGDFR